MSRLSRVAPIGIPQHVIQRGNNRQVCFRDEHDFGHYAGWLNEYARKYGVAIHAWVFMSNHVHLLCTPSEEGAVSKMMQALGRQYVRYFNGKYKRSGTLWEGRFKSCLIDSDAYLFEVYRYIELNPVRAKMVNDPAEYKWSSFQVNALGRLSDLCVPHVLYGALGRTASERQDAYKALFTDVIDDLLLDDLRSATRAGMALGTETFKSMLEVSGGRRLNLKKRGPSPVGK
jgi:putative transposase